MTRNEALEELAATARQAISHVGYANYAERETEAMGWIREKLEQLLKPRPVTSQD